MSRLRQRPWIVVLLTLFVVPAGCAPCGTTETATAGPAGASQQVSASKQVGKIGIEGMTCATCPLQVRAAMLRVAGVRHVEVSLREGRAVVEYDNAQTTLEKIAQAATAIGFPATPLTDGVR